MGILDSLGLTSNISQAASTVYGRMQNNSFEKVFNLSETEIDNILNAYVAIVGGFIFNPNSDSTSLINTILGKVNVVVPSGESKTDAVYFTLYELYFAAQDNQSYSPACLSVLNGTTTTNAGTPGQLATEGNSVPNSGGASGAFQNFLNSIKSTFAGTGAGSPILSSIETVLILAVIVFLVIVFLPLLMERIK